MSVPLQETGVHLYTVYIIYHKEAHDFGFPLMEIVLQAKKMILPTLNVTEIHSEVAAMPYNNPDFPSLHVMSGKI